MEKNLPFPQNFSFPYSSASQPFAPGGVFRGMIFFKKTALLFAGTRKVVTFAPAFRKGGGPARRRGAGGKKEGAVKKSLAVSPETLTFAARFPLDWGESRGTAAASGGGTQGERSLKELEARDKRRPAAFSGRGARPGGPSPGREKLGKVNFYNEEFDPGSG